MAIGALVALGEPLCRRLPRQVAGVLTWTGLAAIVYSAFAFKSIFDYPGREIAIPVLGAAAIIAGGVVAPRFGAESLLGTSLFGWLGRRSYSLYLWHVPVIIIGTLYLGGWGSSWPAKFLLMAIAAALTIASYRYIETPTRHARLSQKSSVLMGVGLVVLVLGVLTGLILVSS